MRINCIHGYFKFYEDYTGEMAKFNTLYETEIGHKEDYYTFLDLVDLPEYSIIGKPYGGILPAIKTYAGKPWEIFEENLLVYNFFLGQVMNIVASGNLISTVDCREYKYSSGLIVPGSFGMDARKITGYNCRFTYSDLIFRYTEIFYLT